MPTTVFSITANWLVGTYGGYMAKRHGIPNSGRKSYQGEKITQADIQRMFPDYTFVRTKTNRYWKSPSGEHFSRRQMEKRYAQARNAFKLRASAYFLSSGPADDYEGFFKRYQRYTLAKLQNILMYTEYGGKSGANVMITTRIRNPNDAYAVTRISINRKAFLIALIYGIRNTHIQYANVIESDLEDIADNADNPQTWQFLQKFIERSWREKHE